MRDRDRESERECVLMQLNIVCRKYILKTIQATIAELIKIFVAMY